MKIKIEGEGLSIEKEVNEETANIIIGLIFGLKKTRGRKPAGEASTRRRRRKAAAQEATT